MKKFVKWAVIALVAAIFVGTFVFLYQKSQPKEQVYEVSTVQLKDLEKSTIVTGKIEPRDEVKIKPQISGIIAELYKEAGHMKILRLLLGNLLFRAPERCIRRAKKKARKKARRLRRKIVTLLCMLVIGGGLVAFAALKGRIKLEKLLH